jgi:homocysteine S-methyltransferase
MSTMIDLWRPFLDSAGVVILDGGLATELERRGAALDDPLWSAKLLLEKPELIRQVHEDYFRAGADVGTGASYQATIPRLMRRGLSEAAAADMLRLSVRLVQDARDSVWSDPVFREARRRPLVAASVGSYGAFLADGSEFRGDYDLSIQQLIDWHRPRVAGLADSGADLLAFETIPRLREAEAIVRLLAEFPSAPAWISFSCKDDRHLCHGETLAEAVAAIDPAPNVIAVGVNCTAPQFVEELLASVRDVTRKPLLAYPNSGERWNAATRCWEPTSQSADWPAAARRWHTAGARLIGGCCRTTPATIRQIAATFARNYSEVDVEGCRPDARPGGRRS